MSPLQTVRRSVVAGLAVVAVAGFSGGARAQQLTIGTIGASSDAPFFIADAKGYFAEQGLKVGFVRFELGGQIDPVAWFGRGRRRVRSEFGRTL